MKQLLADIRTKLIDGVYQNEEHVRLSLVARVLHHLGWDIWNPREVNTEFKAVPTEDHTRVDIALCAPPSVSCVFIEVKAVGRLQGNLDAVEQQLRDYNRNHTATFSVITDGRAWYFYYSQTAGLFGDKRFETLDLIDDDHASAEAAFVRFLSRQAVVGGEARVAAENYLRLSKRQRAMEDHLPEAQRAIQSPPYPSLPDALLARLAEEGFRASRDEVLTFITNRMSEAEAPAPPQEVRRGSVSVPTQTHPTHRTGATGNWNSALPPEGTVCRFEYKGREFHGKISRGALVVNEESHKSFSSASRTLTGTSRNGWKDWELQLPGRSIWVLADDWRRSP